MYAKERLISWIEAGDTQRSIAGLLLVSKKWENSKISLDAPLLSGRYNYLTYRYSKGLISETDFQLESAKICDALLYTINFLPDSLKVEDLDSIPSTKNQNVKFNWEKRIIFTIVGIIICLFIVINYEVKRKGFTKTDNVQIQESPIMQSFGNNSSPIYAPNSEVTVNYNEPFTPKTKVKKDSALNR